MKNNSNFQHYKPLFYSVVSILLLLLLVNMCSCGTAKIYKQEIHSTRNYVIRPCADCNSPTGYEYEINSKKLLPAPPAITQIKGAVIMTKRDRYTYLLITSPVFDQKKVLRDVAKILP